MESSANTPAPPPRDPVTFDPIAKCFKRGTQRISGLLDLLKERFYKHHSYTKATFNVAASDQTEYQRRKAKKKRTLANARERGQATGEQLDKEITKTVNVFLQFPNLGTATFADKKLIKRASLPPWAKEDCTDLMVQTYSFWTALTKLKLVPVDTQVVVEDCFKGFEYATAVDVVCIDKHGGYAVIEVKTGFTGYYDKCTSKHMSKPLNTQTDSYRNQNQVQLANNVAMFKKKFPDREVTRSFILRFEGAKVSRYNLQPWAKAIKSWPKLLFAKQ